MAATPRKKRAPAQRTPRLDGLATRQHLLDTAGRVFAERGYANTTSKQICERAGAPLAAVNYHFGGRDGLYEAVLLEAHRQIASVEEVARITQGPGTPKQRLRNAVSFLIGLATRPSAWGMRVLLREVVSPSAAVSTLVDKAMKPKAALLFALIGEVLGLPAGHPAVQRAFAFTLLPCMMLMMAPRQIASQMIPGVVDGGADLEADLLRYVMAGLDAIARAYRNER